jgi:hypothetical protein
MHETSTSDRDRALRRLRRATSVTLAAAGALVAAFAGLAARALPGHHTVAVVQTVHARVRTTHRIASPPPLVAAQSAATPAAPASPPVPTQAPPVVVSGGT